MADGSKQAPNEPFPAVVGVPVAGLLPLLESGQDSARSTLGQKSGLEMRVVRGPGFGQIAVRGEVDVATAPQLAEVLDDLVVAVTADLAGGRGDLPAVTGRPAGAGATGGAGGAGGAAGRVVVVVDVREVPVLCVAGIEVLVAAHAQLAEYGYGLRVTGARPLAVRCLHILELHDLLT